MKVNGYLFGCVVIAALGGLLFGFDATVVSGTTDSLKKVFGLDEILARLYRGQCADRHDRRLDRRRTAVRQLWPADRADCHRRVVHCLVAGQRVAAALDTFLIFRFMGGLAIGGASVVSPMYIAEISPALYRGRLVAITQFNIVFGILLAFLSNYVIASLDLGDNEWRWMFGVMVVPSAVFFLLLFLTPNSPRWLVARGRVGEARRYFGVSAPRTWKANCARSRLRSTRPITACVEPFFCKSYRAADSAGRGHCRVQSALRHQCAACYTRPRSSRWPARPEGARCCRQWPSAAPTSCSRSRRC